MRTKSKEQHHVTYSGGLTAKTNDNTGSSVIRCLCRMKTRNYNQIHQAWNSGPNFESSTHQIQKSVLIEKRIECWNISDLRTHEYQVEVEERNFRTTNSHFC